MATPIGRELLRYARLLSEALLAERIPHAFMGGLAANTWAVPAATYDIDVCVQFDPAQIRELIPVLESVGFVAPLTQWIESVGSERFQEISFRWPFETSLRPADVFFATDPFQREALSRSRRVELADGFFANVIVPEDLLIYKLLAFRNKDRAAIDRLLAVQANLDWSLVRPWVKRFRIEARLQQALTDAGLDPDLGR